MESNPPFQKAYESLFNNLREAGDETKQNSNGAITAVEECELPIIDLSRLYLGDREREECKREIVDASREWGFFRIRNHGISHDILERIWSEQMKVFRQPFEKKAKEKLVDFSNDSYRWGTPRAKCLQQFSWSEAFHIPLVKSSASCEHNNLRSTIEEFAAAAMDLAQRVAEILAETLGYSCDYFIENCTSSTSYVRLNRYPPCPISSDVFGIVPHTDSDFLTVVFQDDVGGFQLLRNGRWVTVKPDPHTLLVNIGDLFQAWSNGAYKSVQHRVMANKTVERFSVAYFLCPSYDTVIESCTTEPSVYSKFSFREFRQQVEEDVRTIGYKVGLPRFLNTSHAIR